MLNKNYYHDVPKIVQDYLNYQSTIKNKSDNTINEYTLDLRLFLKYLSCERAGLNVSDPEVIENTDVTSLDASFFKSVTLQDAYAFLSYCRTDRQNQERTRARKVSCIRAFFKYLKMQGVIDDNPMVNLDSPKLKKSLPKYLTVEQAQRLLRSVDGPHKERDYCILTFFLNCGMRLSELVSMDYNKIRVTEDTATMVVTGKGNKERTVYLNHACVAALNAYMRVRPKDGVKDRYALFLSDRKQRISKETVQHLVKKYLDRAELGGLGYSVHKLRHTAATLMYQTGQVDLLELKEILGHENLNTTQIYTHIVDKKLKDAVDANPLADFKAE
ncbi:MAG: tyrosine recombinase XerC [Clostridia bacterium]|nr:tyrosine recombinase XerC [Clostridia bacterium]